MVESGDSISRFTGDGYEKLTVNGDYETYMCWIDNEKVKIQPCAQNFGYSEKCFAYTMQMGVSQLQEYLLKDGNITENEIASCFENTNIYTWNGIEVSKGDFWVNHKKYIGDFTTPDYSDYIKRAEFATVIESY